MVVLIKKQTKLEPTICPLEKMKLKTAYYLSITPGKNDALF
jgi:hypothetical protein